MAAHAGGWILAFVFIIGGTLMVLSYAVTFGNDLAYQWMVAVIFAFFASVLFTYPIYVSGIEKGNKTANKKGEL